MYRFRLNLPLSKLMCFLSHKLRFVLYRFVSKLKLMPFEFKPLEIKQEGSWFKRTLKNKQVRKSLIYMVAGAAISLVISYFSEGANLKEMSVEEIRQALVMGAFFGFFITNNPCARGKC